MAVETAIWVLGVGFFVQGFHAYPSFAIDSVIPRDGGHAGVSGWLFYSATAMLVLAKLGYGVLSDALYVGGGHRMPYLAAGVLLQVIPWVLAIALADSSSLTFFFLLLLADQGQSFTQVTNDAIATEYSRDQPPSHVESLVILFNSLGSLLATTMSTTPLIKSLDTTSFRVSMALIPTLYLFLILSIPEASLNLPKAKRTPLGSSIVRRTFQRRSQFILSNAEKTQKRKDPFSQLVSQFDDLLLSLTRPSIFLSICWFSASHATAIFAKQTMLLHSKLDDKKLGISEASGHVLAVAWCAIYRKFLKEATARRVLLLLHGTMMALVASNVVFAGGKYREVGVLDEAYVAVFNGLLVGLVQCKEVPFSVLIGNLCPVGCEGGLMASLAIGKAIGAGIAGSLAAVVVTTFGSLAFDKIVYLQVVCALVPLLFRSWVFREQEKEKEAAAAAAAAAEKKKKKVQ